MSNTLTEHLSSKNIVFWTGHFDPRCDAVSKEIAGLRLMGGASRVVSLTPLPPPDYHDQGVRWVHPRAYRILARLFVPWFSRRAALHHIFYPLPADPFLARLAGRNILLTSISRFPKESSLSTNARAVVRMMIVESERDRDDALAAGWNPDAVKIVLPGVDLDYFRAATPASDSKSFTIVFAGVPFLPGYAQARGVDLVIEAARRLPHVRFRLLCREYVSDEIQSARHAGLHNLQVETAIHSDMPSVYADCHAAIAPFRSGALNKSCPNSLLECLAMGRPVLASTEVGIAPLLAAHQAAELFEPNPDSLVQSIEKMITHYAERARAARPAAQTLFDQQRFLREYRDIYRTLM